MYIYHKQCEIMQKIQWNSSNGQLHWFLIDFLWISSKMDQNYANANASRPLAKIFKRYPDMPYESWRPGDSKNVVVFYSLIFQTRVIAAQSRVKSQEFFLPKWRRNKNKYALNFEFHTSIFNQGGANRYVFRLIEWQNLKWKIVAVFIFVTPH